MLSICRYHLTTLGVSDSHKYIRNYIDLDQNTPRDSRYTRGQSISASESILDVVVTRLPANKLPPKYYLQSSVQKRVWRYIGLPSAFALGTGLPPTFFIALIITNPLRYESTGDQTPGTTLGTQGWLANNSVNTILNIDFLYGNLSFGIAKFVDLTWDVFISRGGQIMLGYITYRVHSAALMRIMENEVVSYDLYATMTLSWASIWSLRPLTRTFFTRIGFRRKLLLFWLALSVIWVGLWPTITNALSGYIAKNNTLVKLVDNTGYANYTEIVTNDNLAFRYYAFNVDPTNHSLITTN
jgi:hypothetical protein